MEYSPLSDVCTEREKPVAALTIATVALATLPPEASVTLPERVAVTACPEASAAHSEMKANRQANEQMCRTVIRLIRFITRPPAKDGPVQRGLQCSGIITGLSWSQAWNSRHPFANPVFVHIRANLSHHAGCLVAKTTGATSAVRRTGRA